MRTCFRLLPQVAGPPISRDARVVYNGGGVLLRKVHRLAHVWLQPHVGILFDTRPCFCFRQSALSLLGLPCDQYRTATVGRYP